MRFGFQLIPSKCPFCLEADSLEHCFLRCPLAESLCLFFAAKFDIFLDYTVGFALASSSATSPQEADSVTSNVLDLDPLEDT